MRRGNTRPRPQMHFTCYTEWRQLPAGADTLFSIAETTSLFLSRHWFETLHAATGGRDWSLLIASVIDDRHVLAMLPLIVHPNGHWASLTHHYTPFFSVLCDEGHRQATLACLAEGLGQLRFQSLQIEPVDIESGTIRELLLAMQKCGFKSWHRFHSYNWVHLTGDQSYDDYMQDRPARLRNTIARKGRKLQREHGYEIRLFRGEEVDPALVDYHAAYSTSWKANEQFGKLFNGMAIALAGPDWTRLAVLYAAGQPAAAQLWFVAHRKANIFRLAYDERWRSYSPGSILTAFMIRHVFEDDRVEELDFLVGNESYKQDWMSERRERSSLVFAAPPQPRGWLARRKAQFKGVFGGR